jgi:hypothetical protein
LGWRASNCCRCAAPAEVPLGTSGHSGAAPIADSRHAPFNWLHSPPRLIWACGCQIPSFQPRTPLTPCSRCARLPSPLPNPSLPFGLQAGLGPAEADRLYRCLYVHSAGLADTLAELLAHAGLHRAELLQALWRAHLALCEAALQVRPWEGVGGSVPAVFSKRYRDIGMAARELSSMRLHERGRHDLDSKELMSEWQA